MKRTMHGLRLRLRTIFVFVTFLFLFLAWLAYSLNWLHQRREFVAANSHAIIWHAPCRRPYMPVSFWIFSEKLYCMWNTSILSPEETEEAKRLFPEAYFTESEP
jgi:hypothetical protein